MTPKQRRKANALIRKSCCNYDRGNCIALDDGEPCVCVQSISVLHLVPGLGSAGRSSFICRDHKTKGVEAMRRMRLAVPGKVQPR